MPKKIKVSTKKVRVSKRVKIILGIIAGVLVIGIGIFSYMAYTGRISFLASVLSSGSRGASLSKGTPVLAEKWYFAEGTTRDNFDTYLCLYNPLKVPVNVKVTFSQVKVQTYGLKPHSRFTINVNNEVGPGRDIGMKVEASAPIVAERAMYFVYKGKHGAASNIGSIGLANRWRFPEGSTQPGFDEYILMYNPGAKPTKATLNFRNGDGKLLGGKTITIPNGARSTFRVNDYASFKNQDQIWAEVTSSDRPIVAEQAMYASSGKYSGGSSSLGFAGGASSKLWYIAEAYAQPDGKFDSWLAIVNTSSKEEAKVKIVGYDNGKEINGGSYTIKKLGRVTVGLHNMQAFRDKPNLCVTVQFTKGSGLVARSEYCNRVFGQNIYVQDAMSEKAIPIEQLLLGRKWFFAEGFTDNTNNKDFLEYLAVFNPTTVTAPINVNFIKPDGGIVQKRFNIKADSRLTIEVNQYIQGEHAIEVDLLKKIYQYLPKG